jgi:16S rRNA (uracil1498-N3)-methyltransferase
MHTTSQKFMTGHFMKKHGQDLHSTGRRALSPACANRGGARSLIFLEEVPGPDQETALSKDAFERLALWQARPGEIITLSDPDGRYYRARISTLTKTEGKVIVFQTLPRSPESPLRLDVYQALPEKERFELILQKLTEIGVFRIIPFMSERSTTLEARDTGQKKSHRWPDVLLRAAKQCRRGIIPELSPVLNWEEALAESRRAQFGLVLSEKENQNSLKDFLPAPGTCHHVALVVGPEGGLTPGELAGLKAAGICSLSLGSRILRTETAAIVGAALVQTYCGDLG